MSDGRIYWWALGTWWDVAFTMLAGWALFVAVQWLLRHRKERHQ